MADSNPFDMAVGANPMSLAPWAMGVPQMSPIPPPVSLVNPAVLQVPDAPAPSLAMAEAPVPDAAQPPLQGIPGIQPGGEMGLQAGLPTPSPLPAGGGLGGVPWETIERSIDQIESGGNWNQLGPLITRQGSRYQGDRAYGRFQFMGRDIPELTRRFYGEELTPQQFLQRPDAQTAVFRGRFGQDFQRFGNLTDAAQAHFAGPGSVGVPGALDRTDAQAGFGGTSVRNYRRMFESGLSRFAGERPQEPGFQGQTYQISPEFAAATGLPEQFPAQGGSVAPVTPTTTLAGPTSILLPGLGGGTPQGGGTMRAATDLPPNVSRPGWLGILDVLGLQGGRPGATIPVAQWQATRDAVQEEAIAAVIARGQQLQIDNPNASPQQLQSLLVRDPVFGQNAYRLGAKSGATLLQATTRPQAPTVTGSPGQTILQQGPGGQLTPLAMLPQNAPAEQQLAQWYLSLPPEQQTQVTAFMQNRRASDAEQAIARIRQAEAEGRDPDIHDLRLAGYLRQEPVINAQGNVIGYRTVNIYQRGAPSPVSPGGVPAAAAPQVAPGAASPGALSVPPPAGGAPGLPFPGSPGPGQGITRPTGPETPGQRPFNTTPQVVGRAGNQDIYDVPDLSLSTSIIANPAHMALGVGPISTFRGYWGRVIGNFVPGTNEETLNRQNLLQQLRSAYASYRKGVRLAGEHAETMAEIPETNAILNNPLNGVNALITAREQLVRNLQLAEATAKDQGLAASVRQKASESVAEIRGVLLRFPSLTGLHELGNQIRSGAIFAESMLPTVGELRGQSEQAAGVAAGNEPPKPAQASEAPAGGPPAQAGRIPESVDLTDISRFDDNQLGLLYRREGLTNSDRIRIFNEARRRKALKSGTAPPPPISF